MQKSKFCQKQTRCTFCCIGSQSVKIKTHALSPARDVGLHRLTVLEPIRASFRLLMTQTTTTSLNIDENIMFISHLLFLKVSGAHRFFAWTLPQSPANEDGNNTAHVLYRASTRCLTGDVGLIFQKIHIVTNTLQHLKDMTREKCFSREQSSLWSVLSHVFSFHDYTYDQEFRNLSNLFVNILNLLR